MEKCLLFALILLQAEMFGLFIAYYAYCSSSCRCQTSNNSTGQSHGQSGKPPDLSLRRIYVVCESGSPSEQDREKRALSLCPVSPSRLKSQDFKVEGVPHTARESQATLGGTRPLQVAEDPGPKQNNQKDMSEADLAFLEPRKSSPRNEEGIEEEEDEDEEAHEHEHPLGKREATNGGRREEVSNFSTPYTSLCVRHRSWESVEFKKYMY